MVVQLQKIIVSLLICLLLALILEHEVVAGFGLSHLLLHRHAVPSIHTATRTGPLAAATFGRRNGTGAANNHSNSRRQPPPDRFDRTASNRVEAEQACILTIDGTRYNMTAWAKAHPGGESILHKFHDKDASKAFHAVAHSPKAYSMLSKFAILVDAADHGSVASADSTTSSMDTSTTTIPAHVKSDVPRWRQKLFTNEDPRGVHKILGVYVLLHFLYRFAHMYFGDPSAGLGNRRGKGPGVFAALCLAPHGLLSLSSLIFHTVPRERIVGKPMIWQEYRVHNVAFGVRSVVTAFLSWLSIYKVHAPVWRRTAVLGSCLTVLAALVIADEGTRRLRVNNLESTTATMPYWEGCSQQTQRRFKTFYAYSQFLATLACLAVSNPAWALAVLIPIQLASLLMTLVRKGLISAKVYHIGYTVSLAMPYFVGLRSYTYAPSVDIPVLFGLGWVLYQLRRRGINKYALWAPVLVARATIGDSFINYSAW
jgi:cytochrome b involved in lipid metabolism